MKSILLLSIALSFSVTNANEKQNCDDASLVVQRFMMLDLNGETTETSKKLDALINFQGRDLPGWDSFELTKESKIVSCAENNGHLEFKIAHLTYGSIAANTTLPKIKTILDKKPTEKVESLRLNKTTSGWKIDSATVYQPHISIETAKKMTKSF